MDISKIKPPDELEFSDDFMFYKVMEDEDILRSVLECLLGIKIRYVKKKELQKTLKPYYEAKGIRLDVYAEDESRVFDVEMQKTTHSDLPRRVRYYQSMLDTNSLIAGEDYEKLKESFVVFICLRDPFCAGLPVYTYKKCCLEDKNLVLHDGATTVFFNAKAFERTSDLALRSFLRYISIKDADDTLTKRIDENVRRFKQNEIFRREYMAEALALRDARKFGYDAGIEYGMAEGEKLGITKGRAEGISLGRTEGISQGIARGSLEKAREDARNFLKLGIAPELVAQGTGLSLAEVTALY